MELCLYTSMAGRCVLVPDCFLPSTESERAYGPLRRFGRVRLAEPVADALWRRVLADLERRPFAVLRRNDAKRLLGPSAHDFSFISRAAADGPPVSCATDGTNLR